MNALLLMEFKMNSKSPNFISKASQFASFFLMGQPGSTLHGYLSKILARSCQDLGKILAKILPRYWQELQDVMVRSYQERHVSKKSFIVKSYLKGSQQKSTFMQIYIVRQ